MNNIISQGAETTWNQRGIIIIALLISSSLIFPSVFNDSMDECRSVGVGECKSLGVGECGSAGVGESESRESEDDAHGGSWVDSFEDDSGVEWAMSDHLRLEEGDAEIQGIYGLDPNAVAVWHFDEGSGTTAYDSSGNGNDGTLINGTSWTTGKYGNALDFDGVDDYVSVPHDSSYKISLPLTISLWMYSNSLNNPNQLFMSDCSNNWYGYFFSVPPDGSIYIKYMDGGTPHPGSRRDKSAPVGSITTNKWFYVVATVRGPVDMSIYINGNDVGGTYGGSGGSLTYSNKDAAIGLSFRGNDYFNGIIDELIIYNRSLTALEIKDQYENGSTNNYRFGNLTSTPINLPPNMHWDTLMIDKTEPTNTHVNVTILNATTNQPIPGSPTYTENGEVDISYIDPIRYPAIKLNATFEGDGSTTPELHYWAVSWNRSNTWQDTLFGGEKVESSENVEVVDGDVQLEHGGIDPSALAVWHFDEGSGTIATDSSGNGYDGTIHGATWTTGISGGALDFDGVDDYIGIMTSSTLDNLNALTFEAWIYPRVDAHWHVISKGTGSKRLYSEAWMSTLDLTGRVRYQPTHAFAKSIDNTVTLNLWQHVLMTWSTTDDTLRVYHNGGEVSYSSLSAGVGTIEDDSSYPYVIGARSDLVAGSFFDGIIDQVRIYNRALSAQEIKDIYQNGSYRFKSTGNLISKPIPLPTNMYWDTLIINKTEPQDTSLIVTILDGTTNQPISSFINLTGTEIDISSINPLTHNSIKLQASFGSNGINTSILHDWSVNWTDNTAPRFIDITSVPTIYRTNSAPLAINLLDREDHEKDLTLTIEYKGPSDTTWQTNYIFALYYSTNQWNCTFTPSKEAELGYYSFKVIVNDSYQYLNITIHPDLIKVLNNKPTAPDVYILPHEPRTTDDLIVTAENSTDIEVNYEILYSPDYWYRWFKNGMYLVEFDNKTVIPHTATQKDEIWRCIVYHYDGDDVGLPGEAEVTIQNSPPELIEPFKKFEMFEDTTMILEAKLMTMFTDRDLDNLTFTASGQNNIQVEITQANGTIILIPEKNWYGTEHITFHANDSSPIEAEQSVEVLVKPTNDLPQIIQVGNQIVSEDHSELGFVVKQDEWLDLTIVVEDADDDVDRGMIQYFINDTTQNNLYLLANEPKLVFQPTNEDIGLHYVKIRITDNNETPPEYVSQNIWFEVVNVNDPPSVKIITPTPGKEYTVTDDITLSCEADDPDLLVPSANERFTYLWYTNKTELDTLGSEEQITLTGHTLPPGHYTITVMVRDAGGKKAYDFVEIVVKEAPGKSSTDTKGTATDNYLWLWILILAIIVIIAVLFIFISKKKKRKLEELGVRDEQVLQPTGAYQPKVSLATLAQASQPQAGQLGQPSQLSLAQHQQTAPHPEPQAIGGRLMAPASTQQLLEQVRTSPTIATLPPQLPPATGTIPLEPETVTSTEQPLEAQILTPQTSHLTPNSVPTQLLPNSITPQTHTPTQLTPQPTVTQPPLQSQSPTTKNSSNTKQ